MVNRSYDGSDAPDIPERVAKAQAMVEPIFEEIRALFRAAYPAEFAQMEIGIAITSGGIPLSLRQQVRRDATVHLQSRYRNKLAAISTHSTETIAGVGASDKQSRGKGSSSPTGPPERNNAAPGCARTGNWNAEAAIATSGGMGP